MVKDLIDEIKATEAQANRIVEDAKKARADTIAKAREQARMMLEEARKHGEKMIKEELSKASEEISKRIAEIGEHESGEIEAIRNKSIPRISKAVELVLERIIK